MSAYVRQRLFDRSVAVAAATKRKRGATAIILELEAAGRELSAANCELNQIARHLNTTGALPDISELREALILCKHGAARHTEALEQMLAWVTK